MRLTTSELNRMAERTGRDNHRWWVDLHTQEEIDRNAGEMCMLVVSELSESMEGDRKDLMDDKLPHRKMNEVEIVDALIRLLDMAWHKLKPQGKALLSYEVGTAWMTDNYAENLFRVVKEITFLYHNMEEDYAYSKPINMLIDMATSYGMDIIGAYDDKSRYNATRPDHKRENRLAEGGKKY